MGCSVGKCDINTQMNPIVEDKNTLDAMKCLKIQDIPPKYQRLYQRPLKDDSKSATK